MATGHWDVPRLMDEMPASLLKKWIEYNRVEPFGQPWENWLMATPWHMWATSKSEKGRGPSPTDFFYADAELQRDNRDEGFASFLDHYEPKKGGKTDGNG